MLTEQDLSQLDTKIDSSIPTQRLLLQPRDVALLHLLRYFEDYLRIYAPKHSSNLSYGTAIKNAQDGMHFSISWIFKYCARLKTKGVHNTDQAIYTQAHDLHESAMDYSMLWDLLAMVWRKRAIAKQEADGTIRIEHANQLLADGEMADRLIGTSDTPGINLNYSSIDINSFLHMIRTRTPNQRTLKYVVPASTFNQVAESFRNMFKAPQIWELGESWDLGGYTVSQYRKFWVGLITLCWIQTMACFYSGVPSGDLDHVIITLSRADWIKLLAKKSHLDDGIIDAILGDLIHDVNLYNSKSKQPDVTYQPFFPVHSDLIALSNSLVILSNHERNIWDLVSIKRNKIHSFLRNKKEQVWLNELKPLLTSYGLVTYGPVKFNLGSESTDLDLIILDHGSKFALCCQLKWLTTPDRIRDVQYTENELKEGMKQAELSLRWVKSLPDKLLQLTGLSSTELQQYEFQAIVLSKNTLGSGWVYMPKIPVVNERLLKWVLGAPHHRSLKSLWRVGDERRYLPKRGKHFIDEDIRVSFAGMRFVGINMGAVPIGAWDPIQDIDFTDLI